MENLQTLRKIVYTCAVLFAVQLIVLVVMVRPSTFYVWAALGVIALLCVYLVTISLHLLRELDEKRRKEDKNR